MATHRRIAAKQIAGRVSMGQRQIAAPPQVTTYPLQAETLDYFRRSAAPLGTPFADYVNTFVYWAKKLNVWTVIDALWLWCADTQALALQNLVSSKFTATLTGSPTFTAGKGFSGFNATTGVSFGGIGSTSSPALTTNSFNGHAFLSTPAASTLLIGTTAGDYGAWGYNVSTFLQQATVGSMGQVARGVIGGLGFSYIFGSSTPGSFTGSTGATESNYGTSLTATNPMTRLSASIFGTSATTAQAAILMSLLSDLIEKLGALN